MRRQGTYRPNQTILILIPYTVLLLTASCTLETFDGHIAALDELSATAQNALLADSVRDPTVVAHQMETLLRAWCTGDEFTLAAALAPSTDPSSADITLREEMLFKRNPQIATALAALMKGSDRWFAVVGAAHLVGPDSIPAALRQRGYTVRRLMTVARPATPAEAMSRA